jgi:hypothetical protein
MVTAMDALRVINELSRTDRVGEAEGLLETLPIDCLASASMGPSKIREVDTKLDDSIGAERQIKIVWQHDLILKSSQDAPIYQESVATKDDSNILAIDAVLSLLGE